MPEAIQNTFQGDSYSEDATLRQLVEQLEAQLAAAQGEVQKKDELLASLASDAKAELEEAREQAYNEAQRAARLEQELETRTASWCSEQTPRPGRPACRGEGSLTVSCRAEKDG